MSANFSPTAEAARRLAARPDSRPPFAVASAPPPPAARPAVAPAENWCEWPRRGPATPARTGIWQALRQIQARHA